MLNETQVAESGATGTGMEGDAVKVWDCKIGGRDVEDVSGGADFPMRRAIERAYREITGKDPEFIFSGWGGQLTEAELAVVEGREPRTPISD